MARLLRCAGLLLHCNYLLRASFALLLVAWVWPSSSIAATSCRGTHNIRLKNPVHIDPDVRSELQSLRPLAALSVDAPPIVLYDRASSSYEGIAVDILCFIFGKLGVQFDIAPPSPEESVVDKLQRLQTGDVDLFFPASHSAQRAELGLFTDDFVVSYYAVIGPQSAAIAIRSFEDLAPYRIGYVSGGSFEPILKAYIPASQLHAFDQYAEDAPFKAIQDGSIDLLIYNQHAFTETRFREELFDLEVKYTFYEYPRTYRYYFSATPAHERLVQAVNLYLAAIDISDSVAQHQFGERELLERYVSQRTQRTFLVALSMVAVLVAAMASFALIHHRRLMQVIQERNAEIARQHRALSEANQKLTSLSRTDALTEIPNRRYFDERAPAEYARAQRHAWPLSLLFVDVDRFKNVNDKYGHHRGDEYLQRIAQVLRRCAGRSSDIVARYGGEEFVCLLADTPAEDARSIAERIRLAVEGLHLPNESPHSTWVTVSIGAATLTGGDPGLGTLLAQADAQLYRAKQDGRNQVRSVELNEGAP